jgi:hypothetical protein
LPRGKTLGVVCIDAQYLLEGGESAHKVWEDLEPSEAVEIIQDLLREESPPVAVLVSQREIPGPAKKSSP